MGSRRCPHVGTAPRRCARREAHPARRGFSPRPNIACASPGECLARSARTTIWRVRISGSSPLLDGYDEPEILLPQTLESVSQALTPDSGSPLVPLGNLAASENSIALNTLFTASGVLDGRSPPECP